MSTIQRTEKQLGKPSVLTNTIHLPTATFILESGPTFVLVHFMLHLPTEALNAPPPPPPPARYGPAPNVNESVNKIDLLPR